LSTNVDDNFATAALIFGILWLMANESIGGAVTEFWNRAKSIFLSTLQSIDEKDHADRYLSMVTRAVKVDNTIILMTVNEFAADYIQRTYGEKLKLSFGLAGGEEGLSVIFKEDKEQKPISNEPKPEEQKRKVVQKISTFVSTMPMNPEYTFKEFVPGPSNSFALSAAKAIVKNPGKNGFYNPFFIHGGTGLGKTHLMQAIGNELKERDRSLAICYLTAETFLNEYINALKNDRISSFRERYRKIDVLLLDDVQFFQRGKDVQEEFFNTFNALQNAHKQIVMTSDVAPMNLPSLEARLISRFEGGLVQEIESPSYETRLAILRKKAESVDMPIPMFVLEFIADNIKSHVRAMEGALSKVCMCHVTNPAVPLTKEVLAIWLRESIQKEQSLKKLTIEEIQAAVAKKFGVSLQQIISQERTQCLVTPRQLAMFISRKLTTRSLQEIAEAFGKKHATILHGVKMIEERLENENDLKLAMEEIVSQFGYKMSDVMD